MHQQKLPWLRVVLLTAVTIVSGVSLTRLTFDPSPRIAAPKDEYFATLEQSNARFLSNDYIIVTVEHDRVFTEDGIRLIAKITDTISELPEVSGALSFSTLAEVVDEDEGLTTKRLIDLDAPIDDEQIGALRSFLDRYTFIRELTSTADQKSAAVVVIPAPEVREADFASAVFSATDAMDIPRDHVFGSPVLIYYAARDNVHDSASLLILALGVVFLVEWLVTRRLLLALLLWWSAVTPVIWTMALFIIFDIQLKIETMIIPVTVLALATSYGIHIHRYHATHLADGFRTNLKKSTSIVLVAGITTLAGFASLMVSKLPVLQTVGLISATGVGLSIIAALTYMAPIYEWVSTRFSVQPSFFERAKPRVSRIVAVFVILATIVVGIGAFRVYVNPRFATIFRVQSEPSRAMAYFESRYFSGDTLELHLDTGIEYGLVDLETYRSVESILEQLESIDDVSAVYAFTDLIEWFNGGPPDSDVKIGEALEMLSSSSEGLNIGAFVDVTYRAAKIFIRPQTAHNGHREFSDTINRIEARITEQLEAHHFPGTWIIGGSSSYIQKVNRYFAEGQISGVVVFIAAVFVVALLFLRSLRLAFIALIPPVFSAVVFIGFVGWSGVPLNIAASVGFATVLGVSVDDIMYFLLYHRSIVRAGESYSVMEAIRKAGPAIIETTVVLVFGVAVLLTSRYLNLVWTGAYIIAGLITPTVVTLQVVPIIMKAIIPKTEDFAR